jgi:multisubunit Na+/H+ antiporter MnhE subunit
MKPLFVTIQDGRPDVHWTKLTAFALTLVAVTSALAVGLWYLVTQTLSVGALVVGFVLGVILVVRFVARAVTYQARELEQEKPVPVS